MKRFLLPLFILILVFPCLSQEKKVITVLDFSINNISENDMRSITSFLSAALFDTGRYQVIDAGQRNAILEELSFSASGCVDESCQLEIGKLLSAEMIVVGDIGLLGGRYLMTVKLIETETSSTVSTAKGIYQDLGELIDGMNDLAMDLAGEETSVPAPVASREEPDPETEIELEPEPEPELDPEPASELEPEPEIETAVVPEETGEAETGPAVEYEQPEPLEESSQDKPGGKLSRRKIAGISCMAGGVLATALGGYFFTDLVSFAEGTFSDAESAYNAGENSYTGTVAWDELSLAEQTGFYDSLWNTYSTAAEDKNRKLGISMITTGGGLVLFVTGVFLYFLPEKSSGGEEVSFLYQPGIRQTSFGVSLSFEGGVR